MSVRRRNREARAAARVLPPFISATGRDTDLPVIPLGLGQASAIALPDGGASINIPGARKLHYRGDCRDINSARWVGPDLLETTWRPVFAEYDAQADRTTVSFTVVPPSEVRARDAFVLAMAGGGIR